MILSKVPDYDIKTTCCFTGHRILKKDFKEEELFNIIEEVIKKGYKTFLVGMARGFDLKSANALIKLKEKYNIDIVACMPCKEQNKYFKKSENEDFYNVLNFTDKQVYIQENYDKECMFLRNKYMVDNSSLLIAYYHYQRGGTHSTVTYAIKQNKEILYI